MGLAHRAYSFEPRVFHANLADRVIRDHEFRPDPFHTLASEIGAHPSDVAREVLQLIRFDEDDWLENDTANLDAWYMISLAGVVAPAPNLSIPSYNTVEEVLPLIGWSPEDARILVYGNDLGTLPERYGHELLHHRFTNLRQYAGWLDLGDARSLLSNLTAAEGSFLHPPQVAIDRLKEYAGYLGADPASLLAPAYLEAREMLRAATDRGHALLLSVFD